jgi:hypothetical protein
MSQPQTALEALKKGCFFRIVIQGEVKPEVWTWKGTLVGSTGFRVIRTADGFHMTIHTATLIILIEEDDLFQKHLDQAAEKVNKWPEWKQQVLKNNK